MPEVTACPSAGTALANGASRLQRDGVPEARRLARDVLGATIGSDPSLAWLDRERALTPGEWADFEHRIARIAAGEPLPYVVGSQGFRSLVLGVDERVLIPRPETEGLVEHVLQWARSRWGDETWGTVADVGTGSGCVAISLASEGAFSRVIGTDLSADALDVARANALRAATGACPIEWRRGSLLAPLARQRVDIIVANPPYVAEGEWAALDRGVREFEPRLALVSAEGGLAHTRQLLDAAPAVLAPGGLVALEIDARRAEATLRLAQRGGWDTLAVRDDVFGRPRYLLATREQS